MPVRSPLSRWPPTAQLRSRCLGVFSLYSLCKQWTVLCFDHCLWLSCFLMQWPILSATAGVTPVLFATFVIVHVLQPLVCAAAAPLHALNLRPAICFTCCPQQSMLSSRFACIRYSHVAVAAHTNTASGSEGRAPPPPALPTTTLPRDVL